MKYLSLAILFLFVACSKDSHLTIEGAQMGIPYKVIIKDKLTKKQTKQVYDIIDNSFKVIDHTFNGWNSYSEISLWNNSKSTRPIKISARLFDLVKLCDKAHSMTNGAFDPSLGKLIHAWKMSLRIGKLLSDQEVQKIAPAVGWNKVIIGESTLQKTHPDLSLDLDGISKGYFCDLCIQRLKDAGYKNALVEWGGEIKTLDGPFKVLCGDKIINLTNSSIATSGTKFQLYPISIDSNTLIYSHFIDPNSLVPVLFDGKRDSTSVILESCALADALATSSFLTSSL